MHRVEVSAVDLYVKYRIGGRRFLCRTREQWRDFLIEGSLFVFGPGLQRNPRLPGAATSCARESYDVKDEQKHVREEHRYGRTVKGRANQEKTKHDFLFGRAKLSSPQ